MSSGCPALELTCMGWDGPCGPSVGWKAYLEHYLGGGMDQGLGP
jgi:hypothetical protein